MQKMCDKLGLRFVRCAVKEKGNDEPTIAQIKKATDKIEEEHHAIIFLYKTNRFSVLSYSVRFKMQNTP